MPLRIFRSNDERIVSIFMVRTSVGVRTRRPLWSTWRTVAPVGAWFNSVGKTDAVDYGAGAPLRAEELPFTILIPEFRVGFSEANWLIQMHLLSFEPFSLPRSHCSGPLTMRSPQKGPHVHCVVQPP